MGDDFPISSTETLMTERLQAFRTLCDENALLCGDKIWGNKITTEQLWGLEEHNALNDLAIDLAERFLNVMSGYRVIFITRHGASCAESKVRRTGQPMVRAAIRWCYSARFYERLNKLGGILFKCRYEDLVSDPEVTLTQVCNALGLAFHHDMLSQTASDLLMPDYRHGRFLAEKANDIPKLAPEITALINPWLSRLGYQTC